MYPTLVIILVAYAKNCSKPVLRNGPSSGSATRSPVTVPPTPRKGPRARALDFLHSLNHGNVDTIIPLSIIDISPGAEGGERLTAQETGEEEFRKGSIAGISAPYDEKVLQV